MVSNSYTHTAHKWVLRAPIFPSHRYAALMHMFANSFDLVLRLYANILIGASGTHSARLDLDAQQIAL